jgi:uridine kinase
MVDWDDPASWLADDAVAAIATLCRDGVGKVPVYDIPSNGRTGWHEVDLEGAACLVAEGLFAQEIVPRLQAEGLLAAAYCLTQPPLVTFWRRLVRDLREHRKPPAVLVRRGLALMRDQRRVVAHAVGLGCRPLSAEDALAAIRDLAGSPVGR